MPLPTLRYLKYEILRSAKKKEGDVAFEVELGHSSDKHLSILVDPFFILVRLEDNMYACVYCRSLSEIISSLLSEETVSTKRFCLQAISKTEVFVALGLKLEAFCQFNLSTFILPPSIDNLWICRV